MKIITIEVCYADEPQEGFTKSLLEGEETELKETLGSALAALVTQSMNQSDDGAITVSLHDRLSECKVEWSRAAIVHSSGNPVE